jgi:hypothetical protein
MDIDLEIDLGHQIVDLEEMIAGMIEEMIAGETERMIVMIDIPMTDIENETNHVKKNAMNSVKKDTVFVVINVVMNMVPLIIKDQRKCQFDRKCLNMVMNVIDHLH